MRVANPDLRANKCCPVHTGGINKFRLFGLVTWYWRLLSTTVHYTPCLTDSNQLKSYANVYGTRSMDLLWVAYGFELNGWDRPPLSSNWVTIYHWMALLGQHTCKMLLTYMINTWVHKTRNQRRTITRLLTLNYNAILRLNWFRPTLLSLSCLWFYWPMHNSIDHQSAVSGD